MASKLLRPLSIGEILDGAFSVYRIKFSGLVGLALALLLPGALLYFVHPALGMFASLIGTLLAQVATVWIASEFLLGNRVSSKQALGVAVRRAIPYLAALLLYSVGIGIATMLLIIPGIIAWLMWFAFVPIVVIEGKILFFGRSRMLAKKSWGKIFLVQAVLAIILTLPTLIVFGAAIGMGQFDVAAGQLPPMFQSISSIVSALTLPLTSVTWVLLYYDQRVRKEGLDVELSTASLGEPSTA